MIKLDDGKEATSVGLGVPDSVFEKQSKEVRERWFQACNPPQLPPKGTALSGTCSPVDGLASVNTGAQVRPDDRPHLNEESPSRSPLFASESITAEGRRQVSVKD
jgi:hypothetical protein